MILLLPLTLSHCQQAEATLSCVSPPLHLGRFSPYMQHESHKLNSSTDKLGSRVGILFLYLSSILKTANTTTYLSQANSHG
jgi:hypothetical protein